MLSVKTSKGKPSAAEVAAGFSITGLLDAGTKTRERFPIEEIPVELIADHPANTAYSMDGESIRSLADSIRRDGLTDIPLVRKMADGSWQMISGHRRKAAYTLLAQEDNAFARIPCRIIANITDEQAVALLHTANYFVRQLTVTERAEATRALGLEARALLKSDPAFAGMKADDVKAAIITAQTGRAVSPKTIRRTERMARQIANDLTPEWAREADAGNLSEQSVNALARMDASQQEALFAKRGGRALSKQENSALIKEATADSAAPDKRLVQALKNLETFERNRTSRLSDAETEAVSAIGRLSARILEMDD